MEIVGEKDVLIEREDLIPYGFDGTATLKQLPATPGEPERYLLSSDFQDREEALALFGRTLRR